MLWVDTLSDAPKPGGTDHRPAKLTQLKDLNRPGSTGESSYRAGDTQYHTLGFLQTPYEENDSHIVFHDQSSGQWYSPTHLEQVLSTSEYTQRMDPQKITFLAKLLVISHIVLSSVRRTLDAEPQLHDYRYFCRSTEEAIFFEGDFPLILDPWFSFGFGSRQESIIRDASSDYNRPAHAPVDSLGVALHGIGTARPQNFGRKRTDLAQAKQTVCADMDRRAGDIAKFAGPQFCSIVDDCLKVGAAISTIVDSERRESHEFVHLCNIVVRLSELEHQLENTISWRPENLAPGSWLRNCKQRASSCFSGRTQNRWGQAS